MIRVLVIGSLALLLAAEDWPGFRGPTRQGVSLEHGLPTKWSATENVAWKTPIPGQGWSSPIVHGDRVFITTATEGGASCHVLSLDLASGKVLWDREVFRQEVGKKRAKNSFATPTPVTDGETVYAVFYDGSFVALDFDGNAVWTNRDMKFFSEHGLGASPILYEDLLIMPFDGNSPENAKIGWKIPWDEARILALEKSTGEVRWSAKRGPSRIAHVTPNVLRHNGAAQLVSAAGDVIQGHDLTNGERLWSVYSQGEGVVPSAVVGDGLVFVTSGFEKPTIRAVRPGGEIVWEQTRNVPKMTSFIYHKERLFAIGDGGIVVNLRADSGETVWQGRVGGDHSASPILVGDLIYFLSEEGETTIIKAADEFEVVARNSIGEKCQASFAASQGRLLIRGEENLYCIREMR